MLIVIDLNTEGMPTPMNKDNVIVEYWSDGLSGFLSLQSLLSKSLSKLMIE